MYVAFIDSEAAFPPVLITSLSIFGKSCFLWSSVIYVFFNKSVKKHYSHKVKFDHG
jgi:predicted membrane channel-forming protein YqfA (hemolysin III family)